MNRPPHILVSFVLAVLLACGSMPLCNSQDFEPNRPAVETAVIEGVSPGTTTVEELNQLWGEPRLEGIRDDEIVRL